MQQQHGQGQVVCTGCRVLLGYPHGAPCVRCPMCQTVTVAGQVQIRCVACGIGLALPATAQLAQCPRCRIIMAMPRLPQNTAPSASAAPAPPPAPPKQVIYIENPPIKDESGKTQTDTAVGTKIDDD